MLDVYFLVRKSLQNFDLPYSFEINEDYVCDASQRAKSIMHEAVLTVKESMNSGSRRKRLNGP